ncbi:MAG: hypothetical protein AAB875_04615 [Patescibacteria group bacterium]
MKEGEKGMTYIEIVKEHFPFTSDNEADFILWEFTPYPLERDETTLRKFLSRFKRACDLKRKICIGCGKFMSMVWPDMCGKCVVDGRA